MSLQSVREFFQSRDIQLPIIETEASTATVALAAEAHGVEPGRIAKTLAFRLGDGRAIVLVAAGDARIDNKKFKDAFGKGKMLGTEDVVALTGHTGGALAGRMRETDVLICVPHERPARVREVHDLVLNCLCDGVDTQLLGEQEM